MIEAVNFCVSVAVPLTLNSAEVSVPSDVSNLLRPKLLLPDPENDRVAALAVPASEAAQGQVSIHASDISGFQCKFTPR